ncbi:MAG: hypothetical protein WA461_10850 [Nitrososphaeraceae archaeon]
MCDFKALARVLGIYKKLTFEPKSEIGTKIGFLTDINKDNIPYCKALRKLAIEVRHLDGVKANFVVGNTECIGIVTMNEELQQPEQQEQKDDEGLQQQQQQQIMQPQSL